MQPLRVLYSALMTTQTVLRHPSDTLDDEPVAVVEPTATEEPAPPVLLLTGDAEIIRRIRLAAPRYWEDAPSQSLVSAIAVNYDREIGLRGTCGTDRARRLRDLAGNLDLVLPEDTPVDLDEDAEQTEASQLPGSVEVLTVDVVDAPAGEPAPEARPARSRRPWLVLLLTLPAFVAIWSGWVGMGKLTGFGPVYLLPGTPLADWRIDTSITLPIGMEAYAAYALSVWLVGGVPDRARRFARWSAIGSLGLGMAGQVAYHLMSAAHMVRAPWPITAIVACLPVIVLGLGAALAHLTHTSKES